MLIKKLLPNKVSKGSDDFQYEKVGFDSSSNNSGTDSLASMGDTSQQESNSTSDSGSALDFMNFK